MQLGELSMCLDRMHRCLDDAGRQAPVMTATFLWLLMVVLSFLNSREYPGASEKKMEIPF